jgi:hypothetical protein
MEAILKIGMDLLVRNDPGWGDGDRCASDLAGKLRDNLEVFPGAQQPESSLAIPQGFEIVGGTGLSILYGPSIGNRCCTQSFVMVTRCCANRANETLTKGIVVDMNDWRRPDKAIVSASFVVK